jgi:hypothetical protein
MSSLLFFAQVLNSVLFRNDPRATHCFGVWGVALKIGERITVLAVKSLPVVHGCVTNCAAAESPSVANEFDATTEFSRHRGRLRSLVQ